MIIMRMSRDNGGRREMHFSSKRALRNGYNEIKRHEIHVRSIGRRAKQAFQSTESPSALHSEFLTDEHVRRPAFVRDERILSRCNKSTRESTL